MLLGSVLTGATRSMEMGKALVGHDFVVKSCHLLRRPDMLFKFKEFMLLIECDEHGHFDRTLASEMSHLEVIKQWASEALGLSKILQVRINPDGRQPMFRRKKVSNGEQVWQVTGAGEKKMQELFADLSDVIDCGLDGTDTAELFAGAIDCGGLSVATRRFFFA